jgi:hypothetical protein
MYVGVEPGAFRPACGHKGDQTIGGRIDAYRIYLVCRAVALVIAEIIVGITCNFCQTCIGEL